MGKFLIGIVLILFGGTITIDSFIIELTPNFIGSLLLLSSMKDFQIRCSKIQRALYILTGLFFINYILQMLNLDGIIVIVSSILTGMTMLLSLYLAIKLIEQIQEKQEIVSNNRPFIIWFWILFGVTIVMQIIVIILILMPQNVVTSISALFGLHILCILIGVIGSCRLIYWFYKELKYLSLKK